MKKTSVFQDAIRLLFILVNGSEKLRANEDGFVAIFDGKAKLHAMDFWVRYPDFLAYELMNKYEELQDSKYLELAKTILKEQEPDLRNIPMIRFRFGAFDDLNESLSILLSKGLIVQKGIKTKDKIINYDYYDTKDAEQLVGRIIKEFKILTWYDDRSKIVKEIAGNLGGGALKDKQYKHLTYATTLLGSNIPTIKNEVEARLNKLING